MTNTDIIRSYDSRKAARDSLKEIRNKIWRIVSEACIAAGCKVPPRRRVESNAAGRLRHLTTVSADDLFFAVIQAVSQEIERINVD